MSLLGDQPDTPDRARQWRSHIEIIAAYRDQHTITADDPRQVLGPYAESGHADHNAYWHAADSVLAVRQLAGLEPATSSSPEDRARAQVALDIFRNLPDTERADIAGQLASVAGAAWLGGPDAPDEHTASHPAYAQKMASVLARRGYLTADSATAPRRQPAPESDPFEARLARRGRPARIKTERPARTGPVPNHRMPPLQEPPGTYSRPRVRLPFANPGE